MKASSVPFQAFRPRSRLVGIHLVSVDSACVEA